MCIHVGLGPWQLDVDVYRRGVGGVAQMAENMEVRHRSME
jgi:hypothetical protein